jgi:hypothetical protein
MPAAHTDLTNQTNICDICRIYHSLPPLMGSLPPPSMEFWIRLVGLGRWCVGDTRPLLFLFLNLIIFGNHGLLLIR